MVSLSKNGRTSFFILIFYFEFLMRHLRIFFLSLKNWLLFSSLRVEGLTFRREYFENTSRIEIQWKSKGCSRIKIKGMKTLPGNIKGLSILEHEDLHVIEIQFFGRFSSKTIVIEIPRSDIQFVKKGRPMPKTTSLLTSLPVFAPYPVNLSLPAPLYLEPFTFNLVDSRLTLFSLKTSINEFNIREQI